METAKSICNICHVRCPTRVEVDDGRIIRLEPDVAHPFGGLMCVKGKAAGELVDHPERVLYPLRRVGSKRETPRWERVSWAEALDEIASRLLRIRAEHGAEAIVFTKGTASGTGLGDAERWLRRLADALGTPNIISTTHLCQWPRDEGTRYTFGVRMPQPDLERSGCLLLWGCNPATTNIRFARDIRLAQARGMKLITVDPRRVGTAAGADLHLQVQPGTDGALALSLAHVLVARGAFDQEFVRSWTNAPLLVRRDSGLPLRWNEVARAPEGEGTEQSAIGAGQPAQGDDEGYVAWAGRPVHYQPGSGRYAVAETDLDLEAEPGIRLASGKIVPTATVFRLLCELLADYPPERVAALTGVPAAQIEAAADLLANHRPVAHYFWNGLTQHTNAAQNGRAISVLYALLGDFDAPGGNRVMPAVPVNGVELKGALPKEQVTKRLGYQDRPLGAPRTTGNSAAHDLYRAVLSGEPYPPRALLAFGSNMVMANGGSLEGRAALERLDLLVCTEYFLTPTAQLADYVLPAATFLESAALTTGWSGPLAAQRHLQYRAPVIPPRGEARSDTQIIFDLAVRLGLGDHFWGGAVEAGFRYELEPTGVALETLRQHSEGIAVPPPTGWEGGRRFARTQADGAPVGFATPTRKVEIFATRFAEHGQDPLTRFQPPTWSAAAAPGAAEAYPLVLTNAKVTQFVHSQGRALPTLRRARPHPQVELHPRTAAHAGVRDGGWAVVESPEGAMRVQVKLNGAVKPGVVVGQHGWWQGCPELGLPGYAPYQADGANVNLLVGNERRDPISGGTPHRSARCRLRPIEAPTFA